MNGIDTAAKSNGTVLGTINSNVSSIKTSVNSLASASGSVKSVQRGTDSGNKTITISAVNPSKSVVLINGVSTGTYYTYTCTNCASHNVTDVYYNTTYQSYFGRCHNCSYSHVQVLVSSSTSTTQPYCSAMTATSFTVANAAGSYGWQVVEYY